jgi:hypothetical protein
MANTTLDLDAWSKNNVWDYDSMDGSGVQYFGCTTDIELLGAIPPGKWDIAVNISRGILQINGRAKNSEQALSFQAPIEVRLLSPLVLKPLPTEDEM